MLNKRAQILMKDTLVILVFLIFGAMMFTAYPFILYIRLEIFPMIVPVTLPIVNPDSTVGFFCNFVNSLLIAVPSTIGTLATEICFSLIVNNVWTCAEIVKYNADTLSNWSDRNGIVAIRNRKWHILQMARQIADINK